MLAGAAASADVAVRRVCTTTTTTRTTTSTTAATTPPTTARRRRSAAALAAASAARLAAIRCRAASRLVSPDICDLLVGTPAEGEPGRRPAGQRECDQQQPDVPG